MTRRDRLEWAREEFARFEEISLYDRPEEDRLFRVKGVGGLKGQAPEVLIPAVRTLKPDEVQTRGGVVEARGLPQRFPPTKPPKSFRLLTSDEKKIAGLPESSTAQIDSQGRITVPRDPTPKQIEQGKPGAFSDIARKFDKQLVAVSNLFRRGRDIIGLVEQGGADVIGTSGFMSRIVSAFGVQSKSIAKKLGLSFNTESYDFSGVDSLSVSEDAADARIIKSAILDMAILKAQTLGLGTGRALSDKDIQNQIDTISDSLGDDKAFIANLKQSMRNAALDFQQEARILFRKPDFDIQSELGPENALFFEQAVDAQQEATSEATPQGIPEITLTDEQKTSMKIPLDQDVVIRQGENQFLVRANVQ
ncbi:MAG: hypothetical protein IID45_01460 [Planctomycetes bacterium]|nr:hypothetical protein [Planctomycetota bacterium]